MKIIRTECSSKLNGPGRTLDILPLDSYPLVMGLVIKKAEILESVRMAEAH